MIKCWKKYQRETILESELEKKNLYTKTQFFWFFISRRIVDYVLCLTRPSLFYMGCYLGNFISIKWLTIEICGLKEEVQTKLQTSPHLWTKEQKRVKNKSPELANHLNKIFLALVLEVTSCVRNVNYYFYFWVTLTILFHKKPNL